MEYSFKLLYDEIGGQETIDKLVDAFYPRVYADEDLSPLFQGDMEEIKRKQKDVFVAIFRRPSAL
jgi:hemoglobin